MHSETHDSESLVAPLVGAAGAAAMICVAAERFAIEQHVVALGGAAAAFAASRATTETARALLQGAALGGLGVAIFELVRALRQQTAPCERTRSAAPPSDPVEAATATATVPSTEATASAASPEAGATTEPDKPDKPTPAHVEEPWADNEPPCAVEREKRPASRGAPPRRATSPFDDERRSRSVEARPPTFSRHESEADL